MQIAGVDEAGRGPLAGPVVAAAVILGDVIPLGLKDSKKCTAKMRERLFLEIQEHAKAYAIIFIEHTVIDQVNILQATLTAMREAIHALSIVPDEAWIDGNQLPALTIPAKAIINGDNLCPTISAASILAKVARDKKMLEYHEQFPEYGFDAHKGYGTKAHYAAIEKYGLCPIHRKTFLKRVLSHHASSEIYTS